jgi:hypothetical protein
MNRFGFKTARCEHFGKSLERFRTNRLSAVEGDFPTAEIQLCALFFGHFP